MAAAFRPDDARHRGWQAAGPDAAGSASLPNNPPGPSACIAGSNSPMPRRPPPTRCAAATAAAQPGPSLRDSDS